MQTTVSLDVLFKCRVFLSPAYRFPSHFHIGPKLSVMRCSKCDTITGVFMINVQGTYMYSCACMLYNAAQSAAVVCRQSNEPPENIPLSSFRNRRRQPHPAAAGFMSPFEMTGLVGVSRGMVVSRQVTSRVSCLQQIAVLVLLLCMRLVRCIVRLIN